MSAILFSRAGAGLRHLAARFAADLAHRRSVAAGGRIDRRPASR